MKAIEVKCGCMKTEVYGKKDYIEKKTICDAIMWFKSCFGLQAFAGNYSHDRRFAKTDWLCRCQSAVEDEGHNVSYRATAMIRNAEKHSLARLVLVLVQCKCLLSKIRLGDCL